MTDALLVEPEEWAHRYYNAIGEPINWVRSDRPFLWFRAQDTALGRSTADPLLLTAPIKSTKQILRGTAIGIDEGLAKLHRAITGTGDASKVFKRLLETGERRQLLELSPRRE